MSVQSRIESAKQCFEQVNTTYNQLTTIPKSIKDLQKLNSTSKKKELCEKIQEQLETNYNTFRGKRAREVVNTIANLKHQDSISGWWNSGLEIFTKSSMVTTAPVMSKETWCDLGVDDARIEENFGSLYEYKIQCKYFAKVNCSDFNPYVKGWTDFAKKAWAIFENVGNSIKCIWNLIKTIPRIDDLIRQISIWLSAGALGQVASTVAHYLTAGVWGAIQGIYHIIKFGWKVYNLINKWRNEAEDYLQLGKLIAVGVKIIKDLAAGGRKRKHRSSKFRKFKK